MRASAGSVRRQRGMASLILGTYEKGKLVYRGRVGTGFTQAMRDTILAQGGQVEPADMVRKFLGREPSSEAFFREITGRR